MFENERGYEKDTEREVLGGVGVTLRTREAMRKTRRGKGRKDKVRELTSTLVRQLCMHSK